MLVRFKSSATDSITMFGDSATELIKLMGASGKVPGALSSADVPGALQRLEAATESMRAADNAKTAARPADNEDAAADEEDEDEKRPPVSLATRAIPLLSVLKRAAAANAEVMWEPA
jgi:hypothetical protein